MKEKPLEDKKNYSSHEKFLGIRVLKKITIINPVA